MSHGFDEQIIKYDIRDCAMLPMSRFVVFLQPENFTYDCRIAIRTASGLYSAVRTRFYPRLSR